MNEPFRHLIVTGATGFIGRHFVHSLLNSDPEVRLTLLMRGQDLTTTRARFLRVMQAVALGYACRFDSEAVSKRCAIVLSDITQPCCGLTPAQAVAKGCGERTAFWHLAASLNFEEAQRAQIEAHNVDGTIAAVAAATLLGAEHFVYVSTAYVCGTTTGVVEEQLHDVERPFGNAYERSKCAAEHELVRRCDALGLAYHVLRPSIVVGLPRTGATVGAETGLYGFARELLRMKRRLALHHGAIRIVGDRYAEVNLIPVDTVAQRMVRLHQERLVAKRIVHLTSAGGPSAEEAVNAIAQAVQLHPFEFVRRLPDDASALERVIARRMAFYSSYLDHAKSFRAQYDGASALTRSDVLRLTNGYLHERKRCPNEMHEQHLCNGEFPLRTASNRHPDSSRSTVFVVNALGMPHAALALLFDQLSKQYNVVTWESRGAPELTGHLDDLSARFEKHVDDMEHVASHYGVSRFHVLGWCTGADVGLSYMLRHPKRVLSFVSLNGSFVRLTDVRLRYQQNLERMVRHAARNPQAARLYFDLISQSLAASDTGVETSNGESEQVRCALAHLAPELIHITGAPLQSPELLQRYCLLLDHYFNEAPSELPTSKVPALFVTATDDSIAPFQATLEAARAFENAKVHFTTSGGHFAPCTNQALFDEVLAFLDRGRMPVPARANANRTGMRLTQLNP